LGKQSQRQAEYLSLRGRQVAEGPQSFQRSVVPSTELERQEEPESFQKVHRLGVPWTDLRQQVVGEQSRRVGQLSQTEPGQTGMPLSR
jgi:hypothetical protein